MKKQIKAEIIADSIAPDGSRLTSFILVFPRIVLSEFNTHRALSRNSASSRAIPYKVMLESVKNDPFIPLQFQKDHSGMQGVEYFSGGDHEQCVEDWKSAAESAVRAAESFKNPVTKQLRNRLLEPFLWHTVIATATDWENFFALRHHEAAEIHIAELAAKMLVEYNNSNPKCLNEGDLHIPFGDSIDEARISSEFDKVKISVARCARISYLNFEGKDDYNADIKLFNRLLGMGHMSPFEHCAEVAKSSDFPPMNGNFSGQWNQLRKSLPGENKKDPRVKKNG